MLKWVQKNYILFTSLYTVYYLCHTDYKLLCILFTSVVILFKLLCILFTSSIYCYKFKLCILVYFFVYCLLLCILFKLQLYTVYVLQHDDTSLNFCVYWRLTSICWYLFKLQLYTVYVLQHDDTSLNFFVYCLLLIVYCLYQLYTVYFFVYCLHYLWYKLFTSVIYCLLLCILLI